MGEVACRFGHLPDPSKTGKILSFVPTYPMAEECGILLTVM
jgi:hypothetical protein